MNKSQAKRKNSRELEKHHKKGRGEDKTYGYTHLEETTTIDFVSTKNVNKEATPTAVSNSSIASSNTSSTIDIRENMAMTQEQFIKFLSAALDDENIVKKLTRSLSQDIEELQDRVMVLEVENEDRDALTTKMNEKIDDLEQKERSRNIIVTGIKHDTVAKTVKKLNRKMTTNIKDDDIHYITKLNAGRNGNDKERIKIVFNNQQSKDAVYKNRTKLKGKNLWIAEDLTPTRSKLAYMARQAVKKEYGHSTWTLDGWIYIKQTEDSKPKRISNPNDLMTFLEIEPLIRTDSNNSIDTNEQEQSFSGNHSNR